MRLAARVASPTCCGGCIAPCLSAPVRTDSRPSRRSPTIWAEWLNDRAPLLSAVPVSMRALLRALGDWSRGCATFCERVGRRCEGEAQEGHWGRPTQPLPQAAPTSSCPSSPPALPRLPTPPARLSVALLFKLCNSPKHPVSSRTQDIGHLWLSLRPPLEPRCVRKHHKSRGTYSCQIIQGDIHVDHDQSPCAAATFISRPGAHQSSCLRSKAASPGRSNTASTSSTTTDRLPVGPREAAALSRC